MAHGGLTLASSVPALPVREGATTERNFVAAIDFGTTYSGYAFQTRTVFEKSPTKIEAKHWEGPCLSLKTPSCILFDKDQKFKCFGEEAKRKYNALAAEGNHYNWFYFSNFKMMLYSTPDLKREIKIKDSYGNEMESMKVFSEAIRFLKDNLLDQCEKDPFNVKADDIHWVLTVPAIWDDAAKQFMREAAVNAGIQTDKLLLSLEPEAASLYCRYVPLCRMSDEGQTHLQTMKSGDQYMILDVGGGTVDITVHELQQTSEEEGVTLKELFKAKGGDCGGTKVDAEYKAFLEELLCADVMEVVENNYKDDYLELMSNFEVLKRTVNPDMKDSLTINLSLGILDAVKEIRTETIEIYLRTHPKFAGKVTIKGTKLNVHSSIMKSLFDNTCDEICNLIKTYFDKVIKGIHVKLILMVGGFSECTVLQNKVKNAFPGKRLIVPEDAGLAVLKGAVLYGHNPAMITARICRSTYGIAAIKHFEPAIDPVDKRFFLNKKAFCKDYFSVHAKSGQEFKLGEVVGEQVYVPNEGESTEMQIDVYISNKEWTTFVDGERKIGQMRVPLSQKNSRDPILVQFAFGDTELGVVATNQRSKVKTQAHFEFL